MHSYLLVAVVAGPWGEVALKREGEGTVALLQKAIQTQISKYPFCLLKHSVLGHLWPLVCLEQLSTANITPIIEIIHRSVSLWLEVSLLDISFLVVSADTVCSL